MRPPLTSGNPKGVKVKQRYKIRTRLARELLSHIFPQIPVFESVCCKLGCFVFSYCVSNKINLYSTVRKEKL